tara:strand:+ start:289 stop:489 length:201 start_codon:yes stop_codon:yes gene_type:complete
MKYKRIRHQTFFQAGALWCVMIRDFEFCSALKNKAWTVGFAVMLQLHVCGGEALFKLLGKTPLTYN